MIVDESTPSVGKQALQPTSMMLAHQKPRSILIVDDDANFRLLLRLALKSTPYQLFEAHNGEQTLELLRTLSPEVILLDICMPGMDGITLLRQIRKTNRQSTIFMTSGLCTKEWIKAATDAGANGYFTKPFRINELHEALNKLIRPTASAH